ncbi:MAG: hypothetical protein B1H07_04230 [Campylobacteraceae bacterium 4484_166]|nr:MAG: hypothetical protein B1H07_04230 [Campylobacteraceae bacterium 4484_166]
MKNKIDTISFDEFKDIFEPIDNFMDQDASMDGKLFDFYGDELKYIKDEANSGTVWTVIEDIDSRYILEGFHIKNRAGYLISTIPNSNINISLKVLLQDKVEVEDTVSKKEKKKLSFFEKIKSWFGL